MLQFIAMWLLLFILKISYIVLFVNIEYNFYIGYVSGFTNFVRHLIVIEGRFEKLRLYL